MRGKLDFVDEKDGNEGATQEEGGKNIGAGPFVLLECVNQMMPVRLQNTDNIPHGRPIAGPS